MKNNTNISTWYLKENVRWTPETAGTANLPRLTSEANPNNFQKSDVWLANGNFLKLRRCAMKLFLRGTNLFSADHLGYADPENYGVAYPTMRSYTIGVDLKF